MSLEERWVFVSDVETYKTGRIDKDLGNGFFLMRVWPGLDSENPLESFCEIISLTKFAALSVQHDYVGISVFDSEQDLRQYLNWIETPSEKQNDATNVVKMSKH